MMTLINKIQYAADLLNEHMEKLLSEPENEGNRVIDAMKYSLFSGGKRIRPFLVMTTAKLFGVSEYSALNTAMALECIHTYSLIHDDLPAMDDDDMRRGKPSCHKEFDEATAILAGDALLTYAFELLADDETHYDPFVRCELIKSLAKASGAGGMVGGQMLDIQNKATDLPSIMRMQHLKTGELFAFACESGAILGKEPYQMRETMHMYAHDLGLIFQITDDLLDVEGTSEEIGKTAGKDAEAGKVNFVSLMGIEQTKEHAERLANQAIKHLHIFGGEADDLRELVIYISKRNK